MRDLSQPMVQVDGATREIGMGEIYLKGVKYETCECCGKPIRGTGKKMGGVAVFVCGDFIRAGKRVHFSQQWATLCESVGFKLLHWHTAHKTERYGTQLNTEGGEEVDEVSRVSFFRRIQAKKGGEKIESEEVLCFLRP